MTFRIVFHINAVHPSSYCIHFNVWVWIFQEEWQYLCVPKHLIDDSSTFVTTRSKMHFQSCWSFFLSFNMVLAIFTSPNKESLHCNQTKKYFSRSPRDVTISWFQFSKSPFFGAKIVTSWDLTLSTSSNRSNTIYEAIINSVCPLCTVGSIFTL